MRLEALVSELPGNATCTETGDAMRADVTPPPPGTGHTLVKAGACKRRAKIPQPPPGLHSPQVKGAEIPHPCFVAPVAPLRRALVMPVPTVWRHVAALATSDRALGFDGRLVAAVF